MKNPLLDEVRKVFAAEIETGQLVVDSATYRPEAFGNANVVLKGAVFLVRLSLERGEPYAFLAPNSAPDRWTWLPMAIEATRVQAEPRNEACRTEMQTDAQRAAKLLRQNLSELSSGFGVRWKATSRVLDELELNYRKQVAAWLDSSEASEEMSELNASANEVLREPSESLKEAMRQLGIAD